ncbi:MAG: phytanoyl-CoA dioxygenase family protein [Isosphaeraceae bacterium]|nr:phytanoyl-CoA dioxygenase family protein [Isosphaeraceae bacterium]
MFSSAQVETFRRDGYIVVPELLDHEEIDLLGRIAHADHALRTRAVARRDGEGGEIRLEVRNDLGDDVYSAVVRAEKIVRRMESLLGGEIYHYHHKMILKDARVGGAWEWHQDYGYWYSNGCLFPHMGSCLIAVDRATRENGCLQVLAGSHEMGRIDHGPIGDQTGADPERVAAAIERLPLVHVELEPGSAVMFHANTLHRSDANHSSHPRWAFICCYNRASNDPYKDSKHPRYSPLEVWPDERIAEIGRRDLARIVHELPTGP